MPDSTIKINYCEKTNGSWYYTLEIDNKDILSSMRTFLTKDECAIEAEWLMNRMGYNFTRSIY